MSLYKKAMQYLNTKLELSDKKWDLNNISSIILAIGNIETKNIQIVGTNGKGTTAFFLQKILRSHGYNVGLFTSPHLLDVEERIVYNEEIISSQEFAKVCLQVQVDFDCFNPSYFEKLMVIAYIFFKSKKPDFIIWEAGLGGRLDATTAVNNNVVVFTPIAKDHVEYLGDSLAEIVYEKTWVMQKTCDIFSAPQKKNVKKWMLENAKKYKKTILFVEEIKEYELLKGSFLFADQRVLIKMHGKHYAQNVALALYTAKKTLACFDFGKAQQSILSASWAGRLEFLHDARYGTFLLSCAHNLHSIEHDLETIYQLISNNLLKKNTWVVFSATRQRPAEKHIEKIKKLFKNIIITKANSDHNVISLKEDSRNRCLFIDKIEDVMEFIEKEKISSVLVIGSIYLVGSVLKFLKK